MKSDPMVLTYSLPNTFRKSRSFAALFLAALFGSSCTNTEKADEQLAKLKRQKYSIDSAISSSSLAVYIKVKGNANLVAIGKGQRQEIAEATYNVFKNKEGKVQYIAEFPVSPKDDWFIAYKNYFGEDGKLIAFQRQNNFFGSGCTKGAAMENLTKYYTPEFNPSDSVYTLTDTNKKPLDKSACKFPYSFPYKVSKTLDEYKKEHRISGL